ncbi:DUF3466 family protein [Vibrio furnissii]|uniref:DUF3466 family protein n=1 Tax=Vibrio furnissii TaxID=29494 RepID=UPI001E64768F|nr:DUF3466 family protein [Vibrio furnissii]UHJ61756.1 DUF3466 family protein [Vibrio furnissii]
MSSNTFKLTFITAAIVSSTTASAALYQVVEVTPSTTYSYKSSFGVAIQPGTATGGDDADLGCFDVAASNCDGNSFTLAGETRSSEVSAGEAVDGLSFREEAPFGMDSRFIYIDSLDDFESYCNNQLLYSTCSSWASLRWNLWNSEIQGSGTLNSVGFTGDFTVGTPVGNSVGNQNVVINSLSTSGDPIGIELTQGSVSDYRRNTVNALATDAPTLPSDVIQSRAWKTDGTYTTGSVSISAKSDNGTFYSSKAALWNGSGDLVQLNWETDTTILSNRIAQSSIRDFYVDTASNMIYAVGYNTKKIDSSNYLNAVVFSASTENDALTSKEKFWDASNWTSTFVSDAEVKSGDRFIYSNSVLKSVNSNKVAIGDAKRDGDRVYKGAASNRVFVVKDVTSPSATYLSDGVFFDGAGGKAGGINNYNEIVGQVDAESTREVNGKPRRKRAFIYPLDADGTNDTRRGIFNNKSWWLDNLTNGGDYSDHNNQYRIIDATDINDAGVISATALKCENGYDTTAYNATCGGGSKDETTVAVKLVPIPGAKSSNILARGTDETTTERSGAGVGLWMLAVLGFLGFRRK